MKLIALFLIMAAMAFCSGCKKERPPLNSKAMNEVVSYYDRNNDGKVDREYHKYPGWSDADWYLIDDNYDGRFEKKVRLGVGIIESAVDLPIPTGVNIAPNP